MHGPPSLPAAEAPAPESARARRRASFRRHTPRLLRAAQPWRSASHRLARPRARPLPRHCPPPLLRSAAPTCSASALRSFRCLSAPCQQSDFARPDLRPPVRSLARSLARPNSLAPLRPARARPAPSAPPHPDSPRPRARLSPLPLPPLPLSKRRSRSRDGESPFGSGLATPLPPLPLSRRRSRSRDGESPPALARPPRRPAGTLPGYLPCLAQLCLGNARSPAQPRSALHRPAPPCPHSPVRPSLQHWPPVSPRLALPVAAFRLRSPRPPSTRPAPLPGRSHARSPPSARFSSAPLRFTPLSRSLVRHACLPALPRSTLPIQVLNRPAPPRSSSCSAASPSPLLQPPCSLHTSILPT